MHRALIVLIAVAVGVPACVLHTPTEQEINDSIEKELRAVDGSWTGTSAPLTLDFQLSQGPGNTVSGSGIMKETAASGVVPIAITGTFQRPVLSLTINGMMFEGHSVQGAIQGSYTTIGGISAPLQLTGAGYSREITVLLSEN